MKANWKLKVFIGALAVLAGKTSEVVAQTQSQAMRAYSHPTIAWMEDYDFIGGDNFLRSYVPTAFTGAGNTPSGPLSYWQSLCGNAGLTATPTNPDFSVRNCARDVRHGSGFFGVSGTLILTNIGSGSQTIRVKVKNPPNIDPGFGVPSSTSTTVGQISTAPEGHVSMIVGCLGGSADLSGNHSNQSNSPWNSSNEAMAIVVLPRHHTTACVVGYSYNYGSSTSDYLQANARYRFVGALALEVEVEENLGAVTGSIDYKIGPSDYLIDAEGKNPKPIKTISHLLNQGRPF